MCPYSYDAFPVTPATRAGTVVECHGCGKRVRLTACRGHLAGTKVMLPRHKRPAKLVKVI
jgi:hypothetical protein